MAAAPPFLFRWPRRLAGLLIGLLLASGSHAGLPTRPLSPDSLRQALRTAPTDTARIQTALRLAIVLLPTDTAQAGYYSRWALRQARQHHLLYWQAHSLLQLSAQSLVAGDAERTQRYTEQARQLALPLFRRQPSLRLRKLLAALASNRGSAAERRADYASAARAYLAAADYYVAAPPTPELLAVYVNVGRCLLMQQQPERAAAYWRRAVALRQRLGQVPELVPAYLHLAQLHLLRTHPDSAWLALEAARVLLPANALYGAEYYAETGQYYILTGEITRSRTAFQQALALARRKGDAVLQARLQSGLGELEQSLGNLAQARHHLQQCLLLSEQLHDAPQQLTSLLLLARLEEATQNWQPALHYFQRAQALRDTLAGAATRQQLNQLETRYRTRQQAQELQAARRAQAAQQQLLAQQRQLNTVYLVLLAVLLLGAVLTAVLLRYRQRLARQAQQQQQALLTTQAMLQGQDEERRRVARDLHDGLGGMLSTVKLYLSSLRTRFELPAEPSALLHQSIDHLDSSIGELRRVARNLMPESLLRFGLVQAVQDLCQAVQQAGALQVQLQTHGLDARLPAALEIELYRIVQELLNNVIKHARASQVLVQLMRHDQHLQLVVEDDGRGFDTSLAGSGVGMRSLQARAQYLGATLDLDSRPGQGTSATLELLLPTPTPTAPAA